VSYDDGRVACTDDALVIRLYYPDAVAAELASHGVTVGLAGQPDAEAGAG
jgi:hypothetical protein